jgi:spore maturation protein CgeB
VKIVFIGLTVSSSWGNGHATTYRGLLRELVRMDHEVCFLEHNKPWYSANRDFEKSEDYDLNFYETVEDLRDKFAGPVQEADMVIVGSYVPQGVEVSRWVLNTASGLKAFYDIDTPVTLDKLDRGDEEYINKALIPEFDLYLSFAGGEVLTLLEEKYGAQKAKPLYCSVDPELYHPMDMKRKWKLGYLGTYSDDRQPTVEMLLNKPAKELSEVSFVVAGPSYPNSIKWPPNVHRIEHIPPKLHSEFYNQQEFTLNVTRQEMVKLGYSPSVRLFEAAACGVPIISDYWKGLKDLFEEGKEIFIARSSEEMVEILESVTPEVAKAVGEAARRKVLDAHTATHRALELIAYYEEVKVPEKEYRGGP